MKEYFRKTQLKKTDSKVKKALLIDTQVLKPLVIVRICGTRVVFSLAVCIMCGG